MNSGRPGGSLFPVRRLFCSGVPRSTAAQSDDIPAVCEPRRGLWARRGIRHAGLQVFRWDNVTSEIKHPVQQPETSKKIPENGKGLHAIPRVFPDGDIVTRGFTDHGLDFDDRRTVSAVVEGHPERPLRRKVILIHRDEPGVLQD